MENAGKRRIGITKSVCLVDSADYPRIGIVPEELTGGSSILRIDSVCRRAWVRARLARDDTGTTVVRASERDQPCVCKAIGSALFLNIDLAIILAP